MHRPALKHRKHSRASSRLKPVPPQPCATRVLPTASRGHSDSPHQLAWADSCGKARQKELGDARIVAGWTDIKVVEVWRGRNIPILISLCVGRTRAVRKIGHGTLEVLKRLSWRMLCWWGIAGGGRRILRCYRG